MPKATEPKGYKKRPRTLHVLAIRQGQHNENAPFHDTWGVLKSASCPAEFSFGPPLMFGVFEEPDQYVQRLKAILAGEHGQDQQHRDRYDLGW